MKNKKILVLVVISIENLLLGMAKFVILIMYSLAAFLDDYLIPLTKLQEMMTFGTGVLVALGLDLLVNFIVYKILNRKERVISYSKLIICSFIITILNISLMFI